MSQADALQRLVGCSYGSPVLRIDQQLVDAFAQLTGDHQYIHVDPERAALTPFGGTIAHGFLLLSLLPQLHAQSDRPALPTLAMAVNYGFDRVRFVTPVRVGSAVRARFSVASLTEKRPGEWQQELDVTLLLEAQERPALVARWLSLMVVPAEATA